MIIYRYSLRIDYSNEEEFGPQTTSRCRSGTTSRCRSGELIPSRSPSVHARLGGGVTLAAASVNPVEVEVEVNLVEVALVLHEVEAAIVHEEY